MFIGFVVCCSQATVARAGLCSGTVPLTCLEKVRVGYKNNNNDTRDRGQEIKLHCSKISSNLESGWRDYHCLLEILLFCPFQQKSSWAEWLAYISSYYSYFPCYFSMLAQICLSRSGAACHPGQAELLEEVSHFVCVWVSIADICVYPILCMVHYVILAVRMCLWSWWALHCCIFLKLLSILVKPC